MKTFSTIVAIVSTFCQFAAQAITVTNFGFEKPVLTVDYVSQPTGATWAFSGGGIGRNGAGFTWANSPTLQGNQVCIIQGSGQVSQTVSGFSPGSTYTITFSAAQRNFDQAGQTWNVAVDGVQIASFAPGQWSATSYTDYDASFIATAARHVIALRASNLNGGDNTVLIDNVRITLKTLVPGPLKMAMNGPRTRLLVNWQLPVDGQCSLLCSDDLLKPLSSWTEVTNLPTLNGLMSAEIQLPNTKTFYRSKLAPRAPSALTATVISSSQINLAWTDTAEDTNNPNSYKIERKVGAGGTYAQIEIVDKTARSFPNKGLLANTQYYYRVRANNTLGDSAYSPEATATTTTAPALVPAILSRGYDNILNLKITGTPGNWLLSDISTRQVQSGYQWWYFVGNKIVKTTSNLTNEPWTGNHPGRVLKMGGKLGLDTFNRWGSGGGYYDNDAGMWFERGDCGGVTTFLFK